MYVSKFLAINLEIDPPDCTGLGDEPEDVSKFFFSNKLFLYRSKLRNISASRQQILTC